METISKEELAAIKRTTHMMAFSKGFHQCMGASARSLHEAGYDQGANHMMVMIDDMTLLKKAVEAEQEAYERALETGRFTDPYDIPGE